MNDVESPSLQVTLANEASFRSYLYSIFIEELQKAREDLGANRKILNQMEISEHLGVSPTSIREYEKLGLPFSQISKRKFYDISECEKWIKQQHID
ncbi:hypothetical protein [Vagococcus fluvialis]|uniref:Helix-turn-helix protein n=1 Tax=Vagococcus fluvialis TaxID=2738 RepID=A0A7X6I2E0_9ENTE|nr:hypothetical protein [Vagococcus fluvialis]NKC66714.1 hypothetical protein [Vagococcus fluvialis]